MSATLSTPCLELPKLPQIPSIKLLGGAELKGFVDFSAGPTTDCKLTFNLLLQLAPLLASMACLFKMLDVFQKLQAFANSVADPTKIKELVDAITELGLCLPTPPLVGVMIKGILDLVIGFLSCFLNQLDSILKFQATIDLKSADGNPMLKATLLCAKDNAKTSMDNLMMSLQPLQPILNMVGVVADIAKIPGLKLPNLADISTSTDQVQAITSIKQAVDSLKTVINSLPG